MLASGLSAFANILAYGIIQIGNHTTYKGWRWIFIIEGAITCVAALLARLVIVDFPDSSRNNFLTADESAIVKARLANDRGVEEGEKVTWKVIGRTMLDVSSNSYFSNFSPGWAIAPK
jgi:MFS family permease